MQTLFIIVICVLILLAITDLVVGVSNDAVNFLVSAIGSKAAPLRVIMIIAGLGVLFGATFSSGMMEIARKGIFHPELFSFNDIIIIFMAVMLTDIILLDVFNTFGLPTSTTVSIVFELLGAAVAIALMLVLKDEQAQRTVSEYINMASAFKIITGILFSVVVAFSVGAFVMYLSRLLFSFNYSKTYKYYGAIWGGIAITAITYFILIKGMKGSSFAGKGTDIYAYVKDNTLLILLYSFIAWSIILFVLQFLFKINILKFIVLIGTFALAMAFAGNDLVNFIGVPLAGLSSYQDAVASGTFEQGKMMLSLANPVSTPTLFLLIAGTIMVITLWFSKKSKSVTQTSLDLSRQDEGDERFGSSAVSRGIVRMAISTSKVFEHITPKALKVSATKRFERNQASEKNQSFDLIRAAVNLMVAGILISLGTSLKLPLSTTYVTFMVAMGTSLADNAWGRESAVYRISGVLSVIGGWFVTAIVAFSIAFVFAIAMYWGTFYAMLAILFLAAFSLYKSQISHKKRSFEEETKTVEDEINVHKQCSSNIINILTETSSIYRDSLKFFQNEKRKKLKNIYLEQKSLSKKTKKLKDKVFKTVESFNDDIIDSAPFYVQILDYQREITHALHFIVKPIFDHINNNHKPFIEVQFEELNILSKKFTIISGEIINCVKYDKYEELDSIINIQNDIFNLIEEARKNQIRRIKRKEVGTKNSILFIGILEETKNMSLQIVNLYKSQRDFIRHQ